MALVRVIADLLCPLQADAILVRDAISSKLATKPLVTMNAAPTISQGNEDGTLWHVHVDVAFTLQADAVDVRDDIKGKWASGGLRNKILTGSTVTIHICSHNEGEPPPYQSCRERSYVLDTKA